MVGTEKIGSPKVKRHTIIIFRGFREVIIRSNDCPLSKSSYPQLRRRSFWRWEKGRFYKRICGFDVHFVLYFVTGFKSCTIWLLLIGLWRQISKAKTEGVYNCTLARLVVVAVVVVATENKQKTTIWKVTLSLFLLSFQEVRINIGLKWSLGSGFEE